MLFEMLSGRRLFQGEGISETLAAVIMEGVNGAFSWGSIQMAASENGTLVYHAGGSDLAKSELTWVDREVTGGVDPWLLSCWNVGKTSR